MVNPQLKVGDFINPELMIYELSQQSSGFYKSSTEDFITSKISAAVQWLSRSLRTALLIFGGNGHHALVAQTTGPTKQYTVHMLLVYICVSSLNSIGGVVKLKASNVKI